MTFNLAKCDYCGDCFALCKYSNYNKEESIQQIKKLIKGEFAEILTKCVTCAACNSYCIKGANPFDLILRYQEKYKAYKTSESYYHLVENIDKSRGEIIKGKPGKPVINICVVDVIPNLFEGALFEDCTFLKGGEFESLLGWIHVGKEKPLQETLQKKVSALGNTGFPEIVMFHDDCYAAYTTKAIEYGIDVPFRVKHYVEYLRDYIIQRKNKVKKINLKVAYQPPCSSRYSPWIDKTIDELFGLISVERVERKYDRLNALCCGCAVSPHLGHEKGELYKSLNIQDAKIHGAQAIVFMCPFCALQMREEANKSGLEPIFLTNLVRMALGEKLLFQAAGLGDNRVEIVAAVNIVKGLI